MTGGGWRRGGGRGELGGRGGTFFHKKNQRARTPSLALGPLKNHPSILIFSPTGAEGRKIDMSHTESLCNPPGPGEKNFLLSGWLVGGWGGGGRYALFAK